MKQDCRMRHRDLAVNWKPHVTSTPTAQHLDMACILCLARQLSVHLALDLIKLCRLTGATEGAQSSELLEPIVPSEGCRDIGRVTCLADKCMVSWA
jgi:hypothetical protein